MSIEVTDLLFVLVIFQLLLLSLFLFTKASKKPLANRLLGLFFLAICLNLLDVFLLKTGVYFNYPSWAGWGSCLPLVFGPLVYFFTQSVIYGDFRMGFKKIVHFLPFIASFLVTEALYISLPFDAKEKLIANLFHHKIAIAFVWASGVILLQFLLYAAASLRLVSQYKKAVSQQFSASNNADVSWLYAMLIFFIPVMIVATINPVLAQTALAKYYLLSFNIMMLALFGFVIKIFLKALQQSPFLNFRQDEAKTVTAVNKPPVDAAEIDNRKAVVKTAVAYMEAHQTFLKPDLTLDEFASMLSVKPRVLSQAINDIRQQNFFDFVNRYRIEEAARLLTNPADKKITVLEVLYQVGFNSKSSFNTLFKKYIGVTPTEFRKSHDK